MISLQHKYMLYNCNLWTIKINHEFNTALYRVSHEKVLKLNNWFFLPWLQKESYGCPPDGPQFLIECFFSRKKNVIAYREFRIKYGIHKVMSENTLKRSEFVYLNLCHIIFWQICIKIIFCVVFTKLFIILYNMELSKTADLPGSSVCSYIEKNIEKIKNYFEQSPNTSIRKAVFQISKHNVT